MSAAIFLLDTTHLQAPGRAGRGSGQTGLLLAEARCLLSHCPMWKPVKGELSGGLRLGCLGLEQIHSDFTTLAAAKLGSDSIMSLVADECCAGLSPVKVTGARSH